MFNPVGRVLAAVLIGAFVLTQAAVTSAWTPTTDRINVATFGGTGIDRAQSMVVDAAGNIYTSGHFSATADLDPSVGTSNLTSAGGLDVFVTKQNSQGELLWAVRAGGTQDIQATSIAVDATGNVYVTGYFSGTADFDPRPTDVLNLTAVAGDVFVWKLSPAGAVVWAKRAGGSGFDSGSSLAIDSAGDVYVTGQFIGTAEFNDGGISSTLTSEGPAADVFVWKMTSAGVIQVIVRLGGTGTDRSVDIGLDSAGSLYVTGNFQGTADFDPSAGTSANLTAVGSHDVFVVKLRNFVVQWAKRAGGSSFDNGTSIDFDSSGNVYVTGNFEGPANFTSNGNSITLSSAGQDEVFVWKLNPTNGDGVWAKSAGSSGLDGGRAVTVDSSDNVYVTGYFSGTADFDPDGSSANLTAVGSIDVFVWKLSTAGALVWARQARASDFSDGTSIDSDSSGDVYVAGSFVGTADFDPNENVSNLTSAGSEDAFVWKLTSAGAVAVSPAPVPAAVTPNPTTMAAALVNAPTSVSYRTGNAQVTLQWGAVTGASSYVITTTSGTQVCATTSTNCVVNRLRNGRAYNYNVFAVNADGVRSATSTAVSARPGFQIRTTTVKTKRSVSLSSIVTTPSRGKKTWTVTSGACRINGARLVTPTKRGSCKLRLSTAKSGAYGAMSATITVSVR
jgi:hypothetical protein